MRFVVGYGRGVVGIQYILNNFSSKPCKDLLATILEVGKAI
jgi:hypothetical protein